MSPCRPDFGRASWAERGRRHRSAAHPFSNLRSVSMEGLSYAWQAVTSMPVLAAAFAGVVWGILGGALPGISPSIAMALLLPFTYSLSPLVAVVLLASVYVGAEYGGSIPAILIRTPGTNSAAATVIDGY